MSGSSLAPQIPKYTKALTVQKSALKRTPLYHDAVLQERPLPALQPGQLLVKIAAASFNHRDLWIRKGQYPGISFGSVFGADGAGKVIAAADDNDPLLNKRVFLVPMRGWETHPDAPESTFSILGGGSIVPIGTFGQHVIVERTQVIPSPAHLSDTHLAAWPLAGVTAWRAVVVHAQVKAGDNVLITGIGGGVALTALQLCLARGATVYVSSGSDVKIAKAIALGAKAGVNYNAADWPAQLAGILKRNATVGEALLSVVIDSAGGDIMGSVNKVLKMGGKVVVYGMTASPKITFTMREVLKHHRLIGTTMGSHQDLLDATAFLAAHRIVPVVSHVLDGLEVAGAGFDLLARGDHFGKVVIQVRHDDDSGGEDSRKVRTKL